MEVSDTCEVRWGSVDSGIKSNGIGPHKVNTPRPWRLGKDPRRVSLPDRELYKYLDNSRLTAELTFVTPHTA